MRKKQFFLSVCILNLNKSKYGIYIVLYRDTQSALLHFAGDFARLLI